MIKRVGALTLFLAWFLSISFAATVTMQITLGATAYSNATKENMQWDLTIKEISEAKYYWVNETNLVEAEDNTQTPSNAMSIVNFIGGSTTENYTLWIDNTTSDTRFCDLYVVDNNNAIQKVPVSDGSTRIVLCNMCTKNLSVKGYYKLKNLGQIQNEERTCDVTLQAGP